MEIQQGAKFVKYQYRISFLIVTLKRFSNIHFIKSGGNAVVMGLPFSLLSLVLGWWGIPCGPIYTMQGLRVNFSGGESVAQEVIVSMKTSPQSTS